MGYRAGYQITGSNFNVGIGSEALSASDGYTASNTAIGALSLSQVSGGSYNIGIGRASGDNITTGDGNVIIGNVDADSATGSRQLKIAGNDFTTTTTWLTGDSSGKLTMTDGEIIPGKIGGSNFTNSLLIGHSTTGSLDQDAQNNTGIGTQALDNLSRGDNNTAVGYRSGSNIGLGSGNAAFGSESLFTVSSGVNNTGLGYYSLRGTTGNLNIGIGHNAGQNITSGNGNIIIGTINAGSATGNRQLVIAGNDGSTTTTWISGDNSGNLTFPANISIGSNLTDQYTTDLTVKTSNFTITSSSLGKIYLLDSSSNTVTATLPVSPNNGERVKFIDVAGSASTNNITIGRNGNSIQGSASDLTVVTDRAAFELMFVTSYGWILTNV